MSDTLLDRVTALLDEALGLDLLLPDETGHFSVDGEPLVRVRALLRAADELLPKISREYGRPRAAAKQGGGDSEADFLTDIGAQISSELASQEVAGLAFVAQRQLREASTELSRALAGGHVWRVASRTDSSLRRVRKALIAVESAIREFEGREPHIRKWIDLATSIEIRAEYSRFRRSVSRGGEPAPSALRARLKKALTRISILRNLAIYPYLRIDDRLAIRSFERRIGAWFEETEPRDEQAGLRLWADLVSFSRLLGEVNKREELREHDRILLDKTYHRLSRAPSADEQLSTTHLAELEGLLGRDDELDECLLDPTATTVGRILPIIDRLRRAFGFPFQPGTNPVLPDFR